MPSIKVLFAFLTLTSLSVYSIPKAAAQAEKEYNSIVVKGTYYGPSVGTFAYYLQKKPDKYLNSETYTMTLSGKAVEIKKAQLYNDGKFYIIDYLKREVQEFTISDMSIMVPLLAGNARGAEYEKAFKAALEEELAGMGYVKKNRSILGYQCEEFEHKKQKSYQSCYWQGIPLEIKSDFQNARTDKIEVNTSIAAETFDLPPDFKKTVLNVESPLLSKLLGSKKELSPKEAAHQAAQTIASLGNLGKLADSLKDMDKSMQALGKSIEEDLKTTENYSHPKRTGPPLDIQAIDQFVHNFEPDSKVCPPDFSRQIESADPATLDALSKKLIIWLEEPRPLVRVNALAIMLDYYPPPSEHITAALPKLSDTDLNVRRHAVILLNVPNDPRIDPAFIGQLPDESDNFIRDIMASRLSKNGISADEPVFKQYLSEALPRLSAQLTAGSGMSKYSAFDTLRNLEKHASPLTERLATLVSASDAETRKYALSTLVKIAPLYPKLNQIVFSALQDQDNSVQLEACFTVSMNFRNTTREEFVPILEKLQNSNDKRLSNCASQALNDIKFSHSLDNLKVLQKTLDNLIKVTESPAPSASIFEKP